MTMVTMVSGLMLGALIHPTVSITIYKKIVQSRLVKIVQSRGYCLSGVWMDKDMRHANVGD